MFGNLKLGLGLSGSSAGVSVSSLNVYDAIIAGLLTYTRSDTASTYRDSSGELRLNTANTARRDYTIAGVELGVAFEGQRTNRCTNYNAVPAATTNMSVTGTCVLSLVSDTSAVTTFKAANVITGNVFQAVGGISGGTVIIAGGTGFTGVCAASVVARITAGTSASFGITPTPTATTISGSAYVRYKSEGLTATATTDTFVLTIPANTTVLFFLNQLENLSGGTSYGVSSYIITAGTTGSRSSTRIFSTNLAATFGSAWNQTQGTLCFFGSVSSQLDYRASAASTNYISITDGTSANRIGLLKHASSSETGFTRPQITTATVGQSATSNTKPDGLDIDFGCALTWSGATYDTFSGYGRKIQETAANGLPTATLNRIDIGCTYNGGSAGFGHIKTITVMNQRRVAGQIGKYYIPAGARCIVSRCQSLIDNYRRSQTTVDPTGQDNTGQVAFNAVLNQFWTGTAGKNSIIHGATGGSAMCAENNGSNGYWYDTATDTFGTAYTTAAEAIAEVKAAGGTIEAIIGDGHEQDASALQAGTTTSAEYQEANTAVNTALRALAGSNIPCIYMPTTNRGDDQYTNYQNLREEQRVCVTSDVNGFMGAEKYDIPLASGDAVHKSNIGYTTLGARAARKVMKVLGQAATNAEGASILSAVRTSASVLVTLTHDAGADFTPTTEINGFHYLISGSLYSGATKTVTAATCTANVVTLTFGSAHGFTVGQRIGVLGLGTISGDSTSLNGTYTIVATPLTTTLTFARTGADGTASDQTGTVGVLNVTAAVRTSAATITLTLISATAGTLYYGYGSMGTDIIANMVVDNASPPMPLRSATIAVA